VYTGACGSSRSDVSPARPRARAHLDPLDPGQLAPLETTATRGRRVPLRERPRRRTDRTTSTRRGSKSTTCLMTATAGPSTSATGYAASAAGHCWSPVGHAKSTRWHAASNTGGLASRRGRAWSNTERPASNTERAGSSAGPRASSAEPRALLDGRAGSEVAREHSSVIKGSPISDAPCYSADAMVSGEGSPIDPRDVLRREPSIAKKLLDYACKKTCNITFAQDAHARSRGPRARGQRLVCVEAGRQESARSPLRRRRIGPL
jgi:hypothetical protein